MTITIEKQGRRYYLLGNTYSVKDQLKSKGCVAHHTPFHTLQETQK